jgi:poly-gamma-glutamate synthesis protein (capsule biosynthesis protein)
LAANGVFRRNLDSVGNGCGYEAFRPDLALMYFPTFDAHSGDLVSLTMIPTRTHRFRINKAEPEAVGWLSDTLNRECRKLGARVIQQPDGMIVLTWE